MSLVSVKGKNWLFKKFDTSKISIFVEKYSLTEITAKLLSIREKNISNIDLFLNPKIKNLLPNPMQLKDMKKSIDRTYRSILNNEPIAIFGDYDVDGATATAILAKYFTNIKQSVITYIPDRHSEGYGPNKKGFNKEFSCIQQGINYDYKYDPETGELLTIGNTTDSQSSQSVGKSEIIKAVINVKKQIIIEVL